MRSILCYGDSNTWGYDPSIGDRLDIHSRWTGVLRDELGKDYYVIEEGLGGRTTVWDDPIEEHRNGKKYLIPCLESHKPLDLVIIMLGTNDLKYRFSLAAFDIAKGAGLLVSMVQKSQSGPSCQSPEVLLITPPPVIKITALSEMFKGSEEKSKEFSKYYKMVSDELKCRFLDAGKIIVSSELDGIHFEKEEHQKLGRAVGRMVKEIFL